jgi:hypothetical protein
LEDEINRICIRMCMDLFYINQHNRKDMNHQWRFLFRNADGGQSLTEVYDFGPKVASEEVALSYTTQFVRDNLIQSYSFGFGHMK